MPRKTPRRVAPMRAKAFRKSSRSKPAKAKMARSKSSREKVRAYRARMRARGFRLVQMWLPDTSTPEFAAEARRQSLAIANSPTAADDQAFVDSISWWNTEEGAKLCMTVPPNGRKSRGSA